MTDTVPVPMDPESTRESIRIITEYADRLLGGALDQLGGILSDTVGFWRLKNRIRILRKAKAFLEQNEIRPDRVLPDVFVPLIQEAGDVGDEALGEMFANLLACHLDPGYQHRVHPSYAKVLAQMAPIDAHVLVAYGTATSQYEDGKGMPPPHLEVGGIAAAIAASAEQVHMASLNLYRLGVLEREVFHGGATVLTAAQHASCSFSLTTYGRAFLAACRRFSEQDRLPVQ